MSLVGRFQLFDANNSMAGKCRKLPVTFHPKTAALVRLPPLYLSWLIERKVPTTDTGGMEVRGDLRPTAVIRGMVHEHSELP